MENPFDSINNLRDLFGQHAGTRLADKITYIPVGTIERFSGYHSGIYLRLKGARSFPAVDFDEMCEWMEQYEREQTGLDLFACGF